MLVKYRPCPERLSPSSKQAAAMIIVIMVKYWSNIGQILAGPDTAVALLRAGAAGSRATIIITIIVK